MDKNKALKAVTAKFVSRWKHLLSIEEWDINMRYTSLEDGTLGCCSVTPAHKYATILIDISQNKDENELLETVRHEMFHIVHAHFEGYREAAIEHLSPGVAKALDAVYSIAAEDVVLKLEHLMKKLNINVKGKYNE